MKSFDGKWLERNQLQVQQQERAVRILNSRQEHSANQSKSAIVAAKENVQVDDSISYFNPLDGSQGQAGGIRRQ